MIRGIFVPDARLNAVLEVLSQKDGRCIGVSELFSPGIDVTNTSLSPTKFWVTPCVPEHIFCRGIVLVIIVSCIADVKAGDSKEDAEARSLLNKFLGAQVILQGMEPLVKASQSQSAALVSQVERQRVLSSQKVGLQLISVPSLITVHMNIGFKNTRHVESLC
jgi:hypothetical protein